MEAEPPPPGIVRTPRALLPHRRAGWGPRAACARPAAAPPAGPEDRPHPGTARTGRAPCNKQPVPCCAQSRHPVTPIPCPPGLTCPPGVTCPSVVSCPRYSHGRTSSTWPAAKAGVAPGHGCPLPRAGARCLQRMGWQGNTCVARPQQGLWLLRHGEHCWMRWGYLEVQP